MLIKQQKLDEFYQNSISQKAILLDSLSSMESYDQVTVVYEEYGLWNEMAEFAGKPNQEFIDENLEWLNEGYGFGGVWVYNIYKHLVYSRVTDSICTGLLDTEFKDFMTSLHNKTENHFFKLNNGLLIEFIATTLSTSYKDYENGVHTGYMIVAKVYNAEVIELFESVLNGSIVFTDNDSYLHSGDDKAEESDFTKFYYDWNDDVSAILVFSNNKSLYKTLIDSSTVLLVLFAAFTIILYVLLAIFISKLISKPLNIISSALTSNNSKNLIPIARQHDEFGRIAETIIAFFESNEKLEKEMQERKNAEEQVRLLNKELEIKVYNRTKEIQALQDQSPLLIIGFSPDGKIIEWNNNFSKSLNDLLMDDNHINILWSSLGLADENLEKIIDNVISSGEQYTLEKVNVDKEAAHLFDASEELYFKMKLYAVQGENSGENKVIMTLEDRSDIENAIRINDRIKKVKKLSEEAVEIQESERLRIARDLHDSIGQMLMAVNLTINKMLGSDKIQVEDLLRIRGIIVNIGDELNNIISDLHPDDLSRYGLVKSIKSLCVEVENLMGVEVVFNSYDIPGDLPENIQLAAFRIVQEALRNIQKHSKAKLAYIDLLFRNNFLIITIEDNGIGFDLNNAMLRGRGTKNLVSRVEFLNGACEIESSGTNGTKINIRIPINERN